MKRATKTTRKAVTWRHRCVRGFRKILSAVCLAIAIYLVTVLVGLIPVNNDFEPTPDGIEIFLISTSVHADVVLPIETETINWREQFSADCFSGNTSLATHFAIGWGDKTVFTESPTWADLRVSSVSNALFIPSETCLHVQFCELKTLPEGARSVTISVAQYKRLIEYIERSFERGIGESRIPIDNAAYGDDDAFFQARGSYHCLNTCNCWVGGAMKSGGIKTGWFTPLPKTIFLYLPAQPLAQ